MLPTNEQLGRLADILNQHERGFIICGPRCPGGDFVAAVAELSRRSGYPILADPLSGVRFGLHLADTAILGGYETFLAGGSPGWNEPEVIVRFGVVPTSKWLNAYLDRIGPSHRIHIRDNGVWADDSHLTTLFLQADAAVTCSQLAQRIEPHNNSVWSERVRATEAACWQAMSQALEAGDYFDGAAMADVVDGLPPGAQMFVGNSLPVRHLDQFGRPQAKQLRAFANRGASGIDGNLSTGLGIGAASDGPLVLVVGDITFYHDMNGLLALKNLGISATIVLLNNNGGGIFHRLPVSQFEPAFTRLFVTPHGLDFEPAARLYGLDYVRADDGKAFRQAFAASVSSTTPKMIEVRTDGRTDHQRRQEVVKFVNDFLKRKT
ncbi:MAG TPA: thiamine pyrophosphate-dependent enzyme [Anaerolineae bacterium]